jgi:DNA (cytosine-5)-methyltransferase 1
MTAGSGPTSQVPSAYYDPDSCSLRTSQLSLVEGLTESLPALPRSGSMRSGLVYARPKWGGAHRRERIFILAWPAADSQDDGHEWGWQARIGGTGFEDGRLAAADSAVLGHGNPRPAGFGRVPAAAVASAAAHADHAGAFPQQDCGPERPEADDEHEVLDAAGRLLGWGPYAPAIARWERVMGRPAPAPTEPGKNGPRLSPRFVEWLMGCPDGWITEVPGIPRNAQLKAAGNGVVRQQGAEALRELLTRSLTERTTT